jgi:hypothetical protein
MNEITNRKPWLTPLKMILIVLFLALIVFVAYLLSIIFANPKISVDYGKTANQLARQRQSMPEGAPDNWGIISEVAKKLEAARETVAARHPDLPLDAYDFTFLTWPDAEARGDLFKVEDARAACREWIEEFRKAGGFDDLAKLPPIPYAARPYPEGGPLVLILLPELGHSRQLARMNSARMKLAADADDEAQRLTAFEEILASARLLGSQTTLIDNLVAIAVNSLACLELRREIVEKPLSAQAARDLLAAMDRQSLPSAAGALHGERFSVLDMIQRTYSDNGNGNGVFLPAAAAGLGADLSSPNALGAAPGEANRALNVLGLLQPGRRETEGRANAIYDHFVKLAEMTRAERAALTGPDPTVGLERFKILALMVPAIGTALEANDQIASYLAATRLMLALEIHRAKQGAYPGALAELVPSILPSEPLDAVNGKAFGYRVLAPGADAAGRGYLLYSFGPDGVDNGGSMGAAGESPPQTPFKATGLLDFVYNLPRPQPKPREENEAPSAAEESEGQKVEIAPGGKN